VSNKAVFLDRDGTINRDVPYCSRPGDFELLPGAAEGIRLLNEAGFKVIVITNQSGIARGYFTEETLVRIHDRMKELLAVHTAHVDAIYYCPHHPDNGCDCRKPKTALYHRAAKDMGIDYQLSYVIGDMPLDIQAGRLLGCKTILVTSDKNSSKDINEVPDYITGNLIQASKWIMRDFRQVRTR